MKKKLISLLLFLGIFLTTNAQEEKFKALFLYNFTKYIEWPSSVQQGNFVIGVLGDTSFEELLSTMLVGKKVGNQSIVVKYFNSTNNVENCQLLFLSKEKSAQVDEILSFMANKNILLVSESGGMIISGSGINFINKGGKLTYEIKKSNIEKYGLKVNGNLLNLGISM
jgi:hypothetical protein